MILNKHYNINNSEYDTYIVEYWAQNYSGVKLLSEGSVNYLQTKHSISGSLFDYD